MPTKHFLGILCLIWSCLFSHLAWCHSTGSPRQIIGGAILAFITGGWGVVLCLERPKEEP